MRNRYTVILASLLVLTGCAKVWVKPGASTDDFNKDKYACLQQSQQQVSVLAVGKYSGYGQSGQETNAMLYNSCMNSRGWSLTSQEAAASANSKAKNDAELERARINDFGNSLCQSKEYAAFYAKSACESKDITLNQLSDNSRVTPAQKSVLPGLQVQIKDFYKQYIAGIRKFDGAKGAVFANYLDTEFLPKLDKAYLALYNGKITWGEFNQKRKEYFEDNQRKHKEIYKSGS